VRKAIKDGKRAQQWPGTIDDLDKDGETEVHLMTSGFGFLALDLKNGVSKKLDRPVGFVTVSDAAWARLDARTVIAIGGYCYGTKETCGLAQVVVLEGLPPKQTSNSEAEDPLKRLDNLRLKFYSLADMKVPRRLAAAVYYHGTIFVSGGENEEEGAKLNPKSKYGPTKHVEYFPLFEHNKQSGGLRKTASRFHYLQPHSDDFKGHIMVGQAHKIFTFHKRDAIIPVGGEESQDR